MENTQMDFASALLKSRMQVIYGQNFGNTARTSFSHSAYASAKAGLFRTSTMLVGRFVIEAAPNCKQTKRKG